jgi:hypothetical protein
MGVVLALLVVEVRAAIIVAAAVLGTKALLGSPGFDQRSIHRKMLVGQQWLALRMVQKPGQADPKPGRPAKAPRTSGTKDCSPVAPSTGVPTESVEHLQQQGAQAANTEKLNFWARRNSMQFGKARSLRPA